LPAVELLGVVDQQHPDPGAFGGQQLRIDRERLQRRTDQLGGTQPGVVACGAAIPGRRPQQHHLLVLPGELSGGGPFRAPAPATELLQSSGSTPRSAQRANRFRSSVAKPACSARAADAPATPSRPPVHHRGHRPAVRG